jgi:SAM-dependent methyltransferase
MSPALDPLSIRFAAHARASKSAVLDVGCGTGIATLAALARGAHVIAIDPDQDALRELLARTPTVQYPRLQVRAARLPDLNFKFAHFSAVHVSRVLHVLDGEALRRAFANFFRWLYPEGKLYISTLSPVGAFWSPFHAEYQQRVTAGDPWPGYIESIGDYFPEWSDACEPVHLLDGRVLRRELEAAGFILEEAHSERLAWDLDQACCEVIARCGP